MLLPLSVGCSLKPHATSLHHVLEQEIGRSEVNLPTYRCTIGAHRGASEVHRENTLAAIRTAEDDPRYAFIEFDVQYTGDGQIVLYHDRSMLRLFGSLRFIGSTDYAELRKVSNGEIALYRDAMDIVRKRVNIEIKSQGDEEEDERLADAIMADVRARGRERDVMISSISADVIRYVKRKYPEMPTGQIYWLASSTYVHLDSLTERLYAKFSESEADYLMLHVANLRNIEKLLKLKPPEKTIVFWDFDDRMYLVHKDSADRLWGQVAVADAWQQIQFKMGWKGR